ncbi:damage-inducible protein [Kibdelosporangium aridum]|uniref:Damage-inducible protein n=1 Tax=Kibdelosporangium aridum TaxID=2030 RepID=A0A428Z850_KIBAR|nr:damage-inducible protein [Kibdelosporangium aridum]
MIASLKDRGETVATAESLTAGLVTAALTTVPGSSAVVRGGFVVYATDLKWGLAGVDPELLAARGAVDPEVAVQLATGARDRCGATWGIGLTGVAGPDPQDGVAPGTVHLGVAGPTGANVATITVAGDRHEVRAASVRKAVDLLVERDAGH